MLRIAEVIVKRHRSDPKKPSGTSRTRVFFFPTLHPASMNSSAQVSKETRGEYKRLMSKALRMAFTVAKPERATTDYEVARKNAIKATERMIDNAGWVKAAGCPAPEAHDIRCHCSAGFVISGGVSYGYDVIVKTEEETK